MAPCGGHRRGRRYLATKAPDEPGHPAVVIKGLELAGPVSNSGGRTIFTESWVGPLFSSRSRLRPRPLPPRRLHQPSLFYSALLVPPRSSPITQPAACICPLSAHPERIRCSPRPREALDTAAPRLCARCHRRQRRSEPIQTVSPMRGPRSCPLLRAASGAGALLASWCSLSAYWPGRSHRPGLGLRGRGAG